MYELEQAIFRYFENLKAQLIARPLNLGGVSSTDGGAGGPPGGFIGYLPQTRVAFDLTESGTMTIPASGASLKDNLNRIRYRITELEKAPYVKNNDTLIASGVRTFVFSGASVTAQPNNSVLIAFSGGGGSLNPDELAKIKLYHNGTCTLFPPTEAGLLSALASADYADIVEVNGLELYTDVTVPSDVCLDGRNTTDLYGKVTLSGNAILKNMRIYNNEVSNDPIFGVKTAWGQSVIDNCVIDVYNDGPCWAILASGTQTGAYVKNTKITSNDVAFYANQASVVDIFNSDITAENCVLSSYQLSEYNIFGGQYNWNYTEPAITNDPASIGGFINYRDSDYKPRFLVLGKLQLQSSGVYSVTVSNQALTQNRTIQLPDKSGVVALLSDVTASGGHIIEDSTGADLPSRTNLQFVGLSVSDDAANDRTVVSVPSSGISGIVYTGRQLYHDIISASGISSISVPIEEEFDYIEVLVQGKSTATNPDGEDSIIWSFNNDTTTANYQQVDHWAGTGHGSQVQTARIAGYLGTNANPDYITQCRVKIINPTTSGVQKTLQADTMQYRNNAAYLRNQALVWRNTAALTDLSFALQSGTFVEKTLITVIGYKNRTISSVVVGSGYENKMASWSNDGTLKNSHFADMLSGNFTANLSGVITENRTYTFPDASITLAGLNIAQTFTANQRINGALGINVDPQAAVHSRSDGTGTSVLLEGFGGAANFIGTRANGTVASPTQPSNGQAISAVIGRGWDGTDSFVNAALYQIEVDGPPNGGDIPGRIALYVHGSGTSAGTTTNRWTLYSTGAIIQTPTQLETDSVFTTQTSRLRLTAGTVASGFGQRILYQLRSSTTNDQDAGAFDVFWTNAAHAQRTSAVTISTVSAGNWVESLRIAPGYITAPAGTETQPGINFRGNTTTGFSNNDAKIVVTLSGRSFAEFGLDYLRIGRGNNSNNPIDVSLSTPSASGVNIQGADLLITAGNGTGAGGSGKISFLTAAPASSTKQPSLDTVSTCTPPSNTVSTLSWQHSCTSAASTILLVTVTHAQAASISEVTFNGISLTKLDDSTIGTAATVDLWYLIAPPVGTYTIQVTASAANLMAAGASTWKNVNQSTPFGTVAKANGNSTTASVNVSSATGEIVVDALAKMVSGEDPTSAQTALYSVVTTNATATSNRYNCSSYAEGNTSVTMSYSLPVSRNWAILGVPLKPGGNDTPNTLNEMMSVTGSGVNLSGVVRLIASNPPLSGGAYGLPGTIAWDSNYFYVCVANNTWKRVNLSSW